MDYCFCEKDPCPRQEEEIKKTFELDCKASYTSMPTFIKVPQGHKLKVGETIRLGGREGKLDCKFNETIFTVRWYGANPEESYLDLSKFPDLEIAVEEPRISRAAAEELVKWLEKEIYTGCRESRFVSFDELKIKLDSMIDEEK